MRQQNVQRQFVAPLCVQLCKRARADTIDGWSRVHAVYLRPLRLRLGQVSLHRPFRRHWEFHRRSHRLAVLRLCSNSRGYSTSYDEHLQDYDTSAVLEIGQGTQRNTY